MGDAIRIPFVILILLLFFTGCQTNNDKLKIYANVWVGYTPLLYLKNTHQLDDLNVDIIITPSLDKSQLQYISNSKKSMICATQYEYYNIKQKVKNLSTLFLFDKSNGGDAILSNLTVSQIVNTNKKINLYLEKDTVNASLFDIFVKINRIDKNKFIVHNISQKKISALGFTFEPTVIVTYNPYITYLEKKGYMVLDSTRNLNLLVVDGLYMDKKLYESDEKRFKELVKLIKTAIITLKTNPKVYYDIIKKDLGTITYEEFLTSLENVSWLSDDSSYKLKNSIQSLNIQMIKGK